MQLFYKLAQTNMTELGCVLQLGAEAHDRTK